MSDFYTDRRSNVGLPAKNQFNAAIYSLKNWLQGKLSFHLGFWAAIRPLGGGSHWGGLPAPASPGPSGRETAARLPLCQPPTERGRLRVLFGVPSTVRSSESLLLPDLRFLTTKDGLHKPPPLTTRFSVTQIAKAVKAAYLGGVLRPQKPTSTGAPPIHVPLTAAGPAQRAVVLFARVTSKPERYPK